MEVSYSVKESAGSSGSVNKLSRVRFKDPTEITDQQDQNISSQTHGESGRDEGVVSAIGVVKDSRQAWLVCLGAFLLQVLVVGVLHVFGVYMVAFLKEFKCTTVEAGKDEAFVSQGIRSLITG